MQTEIEAKFLGIDHGQLRATLKEIGAKLEQPMRKMSRKNFDYPDGRLERIGGWVRVRDEGNKITLSYKQLNDRSLHGTKEINLEVDNFEQACKFLESIGLRQNSFQETKRESWGLGNVQIELDEWPWVKPFVEIEAPNEEELKKVARLLDLNFEAAVHGSVEIVYQSEYNVTEAEVDAWPEIKFMDIPAWLESSRR